MYKLDFSYELGIKSIDDQHSRWIEMMNDLIKARSNPDKNSVVLSILDDIQKYTDTHFSYEESLFREYQYPDLIEHTIKHKEFLKILKSFKEDVEKNNVPMSSLILATMKNWLVDHINVEDKKYVSFFQSRGLR